jgi:hypothetical protein
VLGALLFTVGLYLISFDILVILSFISLAMLWPIQLILLISHSNSGIPVKEAENYIPVKRSMFMYFTSRYTLLLFAFTFLSAMIGFAIHFTFVNVSWVAFPSSYGMAKFYGLYIATTAIIIYGIDRFLIKRILYSYDSPYSLVLVPILLVIAIILTITGALVSGTGQRFLDRLSVFFILITILKVTYFSITATVQTPSLRTLFHSLDLRFRQVAYPRIEGTIVMAGLMISGGIFLGLTFLKFFNLFVILIFALVTGILWFWVGVKLIKSYKKSLNSEISKMRFRKTTAYYGKSFEEHLSDFFSETDEDKIIIAMELSKTFQPLIFEHDLIRLLAHPSTKIKDYVLDNIKNECVYEALPELHKSKKLAKKSQIEKIQKVIESVENKQDIILNYAEIPEKLYSPVDEVREGLLQAAINTKQDGREGVLVTLSKDTNVNIRNRAIKNLALLETSKYNYSLIDYLYPGNYNPYAFEVIASTKNKALEVLEREAMLPGTDKAVLARILRLYGKIGTTEAIGKLLKTFEYSDTYLVNQSIEALFANRFQASQKDKYRILSYFVKVLSTLAYNLSTYNQLQKYKKAKLLQDAYLYEAETNTRFLFKLLSLIYNPNIISTIQEKFLSGSRAEISHAIELTDEYIDEDIKPLFLTIVEDISLTDKLKRLDYYFPQRKQKLKDIIVSSVTYDFTLLNIYTRTCALILIDYFNIQGYEDEIIFCTTHPEVLFAETASYILNKRKSKLNQSSKKEVNSNRIPIHEYINSNEYRTLLFYKLYHLKKFDTFNQVTDHLALELAKSANEVIVSEGETFHFNNYSEQNGLILTDCIFSDKETGKQVEIHNLFIFMDYIKTKNVDELLCLQKGSVWMFRRETVINLLYDNLEFATILIHALENTKIPSK